MKRILIILVAFITFFSCEEENVKLDNYVVIGDMEAVLDTTNIVIKGSRGDTASYIVDLDTDGIKDFKLSVYHFYSGDYCESEFNIYCLSDESKLCCNDTIIAPEILEFQHTLSIDQMWKHEDIIILRSWSEFESYGGFYISGLNGIWYGIENKYIGLAVENKQEVTYGWIKLSIPEYACSNSLIIHEIGSKKAALK